LYYALPSFNQDFGDFPTPEQIRDMRQMFLDTVESHLPRAPQKVAVLLSGGVDSSSVLAAAVLLRGAENGKYQFLFQQSSIVSQLFFGETPNLFLVEAFTFTDSENSEDFKSATLLCKHLKVKHTVAMPSREELQQIYLNFGVKMTESYEPVLVRNCVSYHAVCRYVRAAGYKVCLTGEGADELFGGYDYFRQVADFRKRDALLHKVLGELHLSYLQMADRASMYTSLEIRVPFVDRRFVDYCCGLPSACRIDSGNEKNKILLREILTDVLPAEISKRPKVSSMSHRIQVHVFCR
jgi:asparagine synthase (glutamine-hydrolysing)